MPSPNLRLLATYGLFFTENYITSQGANYMVFERPDKEYKLTICNGLIASLSRKRERRVGVWYNLAETHQEIAFNLLYEVNDLSKILQYYVPKPDTYDRNFDMEFGELESKIALDTNQRAFEALAHMRFRNRRTLNWSADMEWNQRRVLKMREQEYIGPELCLWALQAIYRNAPTDNRSEQGSRMVAAVYWPKTGEVTMKVNPIVGMFRVAGTSKEPRLVAVIDRRPSVTTENYFHTPAL